MKDFELLQELTRLANTYNKEFSILRESQYYAITIGKYKYLSVELDEYSVRSSIFYIGARLLNDYEKENQI